MKQIINLGATSKRMVVFIQNSSLTTGAGLTGLTNASSGLTWYYFREDSSVATQVTLAAETLGTWTSGGFKEVDATNLPGFYELGIPNAVLASGAKWAVMGLKGAANMVPVNVEIQLVAYDPDDAVRLGLSALPNASAAASNGLPTVGSGSGQITLASGAVTVGTNNDKTGYNLAVGDSPIAATGTCQAGTDTSATLAAGESSTNDIFKGEFLIITSGTAARQTRVITGYDGSTKIATVDRAWAVNPGSSSTYYVMYRTGPKLDSSLRSTDVNSANLDTTISSRQPSGSVTVATNNDKTGYSLTQAFPSNFSSLSIDSSGRVTLVPTQIVVKKNTAFTGFSFPMFSSTTNQLVTGRTVVSQRSIDGGAITTTTNAVTEVGSGIYKLDLSAADLNGNSITFIFTATGANDVSITILTQP